MSFVVNINLWQRSDKPPTTLAGQAPKESLVDGEGLMMGG